MMFGNDAIVEPASREYWENKLKRDKEETLKNTTDIQKRGGNDMAKNLIPLIAKGLGVEIGEEFEIKGMNNTKYRFGNDVLECSKINKTSGSTVWICSALYLNRLAEIEIIRLPFNPKDGDLYWTYRGEDFSTMRDCWRDTAIDYARKFAGVVFRTEQEVIAARPAKYKELTGKEWEEDA